VQMKLPILPYLEWMQVVVQGPSLEMSFALFRWECNHHAS